MMKYVMNVLLTRFGHASDLYAEIALLAQSLHNSHLKKTFLESFARDPAKFIQTWLESQSRDLESVLGSGPSEGMTVRQEELKRSEFFRLPWVEEVIWGFVSAFIVAHDFIYSGRFHSGGYASGG